MFNIFTFSFNKYKNTGNVQTFTAPSATTYKLEVWGAKGGGNGGKGGYAKGQKIMPKSTNYYICIGAQGTSNSVYNIGGKGGYNGGGDAGNGHSESFAGGAGGGGATHIASTNRGVLSNYVNNKSEILIVAGGGGGSACGWLGATGGGTNGGNATAEDGVIKYGGTQTTGYSFGKGQNGRTGVNLGIGSCEGAGGGGGGYYGGYAQASTGAHTNCVGSGGSGYIGGVTNGHMQNGVQSGNGKAVISWHPAL